MLALDAHGNPLGLLNQEFVDRKTFRQEHLSSLPLEKKESFRWVKNLHLDFLENLTPKVIHIADREADFFQFFEAALAAEESFIVRANVDRSIDLDSGELTKLFKFTKSQAALGVLAVKVQVNASEKYRTAHLDIKSSKVKMDVPDALKSKKVHQKLDMYCIAATEINPPKEFEGIEWFLLTDIPVQNFEQACEKITWYSYRWNIEVFHKVLKSGCKVEDLQLRQASSLKNIITIKSIIAWFLFWMRKLNISNPDMDCTELIDDDDWKILYRKIFKSKNYPSSPPSIRQLLLWIGKLGGFIGRKSDGMPGVASIWKGFQRYMQLLEDYHDLVGNA
jgi:hypothetical protein